MGDEARVSLTREEFEELIGFPIPEWQWYWLINNRQYPVGRAVGLSTPRVNGRSRGFRSDVVIYDEGREPESKHPLEYFGPTDSVVYDGDEPVRLKRGQMRIEDGRHKPVELELDILKHQSFLSGDDTGRFAHLEQHIIAGDVICRCGEPVEKRTDGLDYLEVEGRRWVRDIETGEIYGSFPVDKPYNPSLAFVEWVINGSEGY